MCIYASKIDFRHECSRTVVHSGSGLRPWDAAQVAAGTTKAAVVVAVAVAAETANAGRPRVFGGNCYNLLAMASATGKNVVPQSRSMWEGFATIS